jgi:hypothetical protein
VTTRLLPAVGGTPRDVASAVNQGLKGKLNSIGSVTLTVSVASTVVKNPLVGPDSVILLMPQTAHAAAELGNGTAYIAPADSVEGVSFKITHANNSQADRTFGYVIIGG